MSGEDQSSISWSSDGKTIASRVPKAPILNDQDLSTVWLCDASSGVLRKLTTNRMHETLPRFAPSGGRLAYLHATGNEEVAQSELYVTSARRWRGANISHALDRTLLDAAWAPNGSSLLVATDDGPRRALISFNPRGGFRRIDLSGLDALTDSMLYNTSSSLQGAIARDGTVAIIGAAPQHPSELYIVPGGRAKPRRLTTYNAAGTALALAHVESLQFNGPDGFKEDAVLTYPSAIVPAGAIRSSLKSTAGRRPLHPRELRPAAAVDGRARVVRPATELSR